MNGQMDTGLDLIVLRASETMLGIEDEYEDVPVKVIERMVYRIFDNNHAMNQERIRCAHCGKLIPHAWSANVIVEHKVVGRQHAYRLANVYCNSSECSFVARTEAPLDAILWVGFE